MRTTRRWTSTLGRAALFVAVAAAWVLLAPSAFGGQTAYVIVAGASMEPALHQGDLVLARPAPSYDVGDIAVYMHPKVGPIIHRIVARDGPFYTLQGDSNSWLDSHTPTANEMIGRAWMTVPRAGAALRDLRSPAALALLSGLIGLIVASAFVGGQRARGLAEDDRMDTRSASRAEAQAPNWLAYLLAVVAFLSLLLGLFAFSRPTTAMVGNYIPYTQFGEFAYRAMAPATVYSQGQVEAGDPVYDALVPSFDVSFLYFFGAPEPASVAGAYRLYLDIHDSKGWRRSITLTPETSFDGKSFLAEGTVSMSDVRLMLAALEGATGFDHGTYDVDIVADVSVSGEVGGAAIDDSFRPRLSFLLDDFQLSLKPPDSLAENGDPLRPTQPGNAPRMQSQPVTLSILGLEVDLATARVIAIVGLVLSIGGGLAIYLPLARAQRRGGLEAIQAEYGSLIVSAAQLPQGSLEASIDIGSFEDLARLAEQHGHLILHASRPGEEHFYLRLRETTYHYALKSAARGSSSVPKEPLPPSRPESPRK